MANTKAVAKVEQDEWAITTVNPKKVARALASVSGEGGFSPFDLPRLSVPGAGGSTWEVPMPGGSEPMKTFKAVVLHVHTNRQFWANKYGTAEAGPPQCQSHDGLVGFGEPGGVCARCPNNRRPKDNDDMTCKPSKLIYLLFPHMALPAVLKVPIMSLTNADKYFKQGLAAFGVMSYEVMTEFGLEVRDKPNRYSVITFKRAEDVPEDMLEKIEAYRESFVDHLEGSFGERKKLAKELAEGNPQAASADPWGGSPAGRVDAPVVEDDDDDDDIPM